MAQSLLEEFETYYQSPPTDPAKKILFAVLDDLSDRRGLGVALANLDDDIMEELLQTNLEIVRKNLPKEATP